MYAEIHPLSRVLKYFGDGVQLGNISVKHANVSRKTKNNVHGTSVMSTPATVEGPIILINIF